MVSVEGKDFDIALEWNKASAHDFLPHLKFQGELRSRIEGPYLLDSSSDLALDDFGISVMMR